MGGYGVELRDLYRARAAIAPYVRRTPLVPSPALSARCGGEVWLKLEVLQDTGSFKLRGATYALLRLGEDERRRGVVAVSTGNHGRGVACAAARLGVRAVVCMSHLVPDNKVRAIRELGAEVRLVGRSQDEAQVEADRLVAGEGLVMVPPFDHPDVIAGQGTIGLELLEDLPGIDVAVVPLSGGGLIGGIALALKAASPDVRVVGVTMARGAAMHASLRAGRPVAVEEVATLADALGGGIGLANRHTFALVRDLVDEAVLVDEAEIAAGMRHAFREERLVVEGSGAVGIAALLAGRIGGGGVAGRRVALVVSGNNVDMEAFGRVVLDGGGG